MCAGTMCAMTSRLYGWGLRNVAKIDEEKANCELFIFFKNCRNDSTEIFLQPFYIIWGTYISNDNNIVKLGFEKQPKLTKEQPIVNFLNSFKDSRRDSNEIFYSHFTLNGGTYVCNDISIVRLGFEKQPKLTKKQPIVNFFKFFQRQSTRFERNFLQSF